MITAIRQQRRTMLWWLGGQGPVGETLAAPVTAIILAALQAREFARYIADREGYEESAWWAYRALLAVKPWEFKCNTSIAPWRMVSSTILAMQGIR